MKKYLTISEFDRLCKNNGYTSFVYSFAEQPHSDDTDGRFTYSLTFSDVSTSLQPNSVLLTGKSGYLRISRIKTIEHTVSSDGISTFRIICGDRSSAADESEYRIRTI